MRRTLLTAMFTLAILPLSARTADEPDGKREPLPPSPELAAELKSYRHKVLCESFRDGNWELYALNADGSNPVNLTRTTDLDEVYPKASPDGTRICFCCDEGKADAKVRNLYVMKSDGTERKKIADNSREPCWSSDSKQIAFLKGEFDAFNLQDFATKGIFMYDVASGETREHPNKKIHHLYTLNWAADGKWFVATVHGGMGFKHGILAIEAGGDGVFDLKLGGCRPDLRFDGKSLIWGHGDCAVGMADLDLSSSPPKATNVHNVMVSKDPVETYHADWSPDGKYIAFSYGPKLAKKNLKGLLAEFPGVEAPGWNVCVVDANQKERWTMLTTDGKSNKEPDWLFVKE